MAFCLVQKQNVAVAVAEQCLDYVIESLQPCKTMIKEGENYALYWSEALSWNFERFIIKGLANLTKAAQFHEPMQIHSTDAQHVSPPII